MSTQENTDWLESAWEHLEQSIADGNVSQVKAIIADAQEYGFYDEANRMNRRLRSETAREYD